MRPPDLTWIRPVRSWDLLGVGQLAGLRAGIRATVMQGHEDVAVIHPLIRVEERLALVGTELATNAIRHARRPIELGLARYESGWLVTVSDSMPEVCPQLRAHRAGEIGGRGLAVVERVSSRLGWYAEPSRKHVWALVPDRPPTALLELLASRDSH
jgi:hypothetical protein